MRPYPSLNASFLIPLSLPLAVVSYFLSLVGGSFDPIQLSVLMYLQSVISWQLNERWNCYILGVEEIERLRFEIESCTIFAIGVSVFAVLLISILLCSVSIYIPSSNQIDYLES